MSWFNQSYVSFPLALGYWDRFVWLNGKMEGCNRSANAVDKMERSAIAGAMSKDKL
jgi:hypothetical protein